MATMETLEIKIESSAKKANEELNNLYKNLNKVSSALKFDTSGLEALSKINGNAFRIIGEGMKNLSEGMKTLKSFESKDFNAIALGLEKLSSVKVGNMAEVGNALKPLAEGISTLSNTNFDNKNIQNLVNSMTRLSNANIGGLANVDFSKLGNSIKSLADTLSGAEKVQQNTISMVNAVAKLANAGEKASIVARDLPVLGKSLKEFIKTMANAPKVETNTIAFTQAIASLANAGKKTATTAENLEKLGTELTRFFGTMSKAPSISENTIRMTEALANLASHGGKASVSANTLSKKLVDMKSAMGIAQNSCKALIKSLTLLYGAFKLVTNGIKKLWKSILSAADYVEVLNYFNQAFNQVAEKADYSQWERLGYESAEAYANSFAKRAKELTKKMTGFEISETGELSRTTMPSLGLDPSKVMTYQAMFGQMSSSMGVMSEQSLKLSNALTMIGADLASVRNMKFDKVWEDMASGLAGMSRTLDKYGVNIRNVNLQQKLNELGINASITALNQNQKALLRTIILLDSTRYAWGDLANTINQPANQLRLLESNFANLGRTIGSLFIPMLQKVLLYLNAIVISIQRLFAWIAKSLGIDLSDYVGSSKAIGDSMSYLSDEADNTASGLDEAVEAAKNLRKALPDYDELRIVQDNSNLTAEINTSEIPELNIEFDKLLEEYQKVWDEAFAGMENEANDLSDSMTNAFSGIFDTLKAAWDKNGAALINSAKEMLNSLLNNILDIGKTFYEVFTSDIGAAWLDSIFRLLQAIFGVITSISKTFSEAWNAGAGLALVTALFGMMTNINNLLSSIAESFSRVWGNGIGVEIWTNILGIITDVFNIIGNLAKQLDLAWNTAGLGDSIWNGILTIVNTILGTIHGITSTTAEWAAKINFVPLLQSIDELLKAIAPLTENIGTGLLWFYENVLLPIASWTIEDAIPTFLKLLSTAIETLNTVIDALQPLGKWLWEEFLQPIGEWAGDTIISALEGFNSLLSQFGDWISQNQQAVQAFTVIVGGLVAGVAPAAKIVPIVVGALQSLGITFSIATPPISAVVAAIAGLVVLLIDLWNTSETFRNAVTAAFETVKESLSDAFNKIKEAISPLIDAVVGLAKSLYDFYNNSPLKAIVELAFSVLATGVGVAISTGIKLIATAFELLAGVLTGVALILSGVLDLLTGLFTLDFDKAAQGFEKVGEGLGTIGETAVNSFFNIGKDIGEGLLKGMEDSTANLNSWAKEHVSDPLVQGVTRPLEINSPSKIMEEIGVFIMEGLFNGINSFKDKIVDVFTDIKDGIVDKIKSVQDFIGNAIEKIKDFFNFSWSLPEIKLPHFNISGKFSLDPPQIPHFSVDWYANGGVFNSPSIIGIAERGAEAVMPLEHNTGWINTLAKEIALYINETSNRNDSQPQEVNVVIEGDMKKFIRAMRQESKSYYKQTGMSMF